MAAWTNDFGEEVFETAFTVLLQNGYWTTKFLSVNHASVCWDNSIFDRGCIAQLFSNGTTKTVVPQYDQKAVAVPTHWLGNRGDHDLISFEFAFLF